MILHLDRDILTVGLEQVSLSGAERCVYRTAALHDAGAAEDKGLVREVVVLLPLQRALRAGSHKAQRTTHARPGVAETQCVQWGRGDVSARTQQSGGAAVQEQLARRR